MQPTVGNLLEGRFELRRALRPGGEGCVFEAWDRHMARRVAIKTLLPQLVGNPVAQEQMRREVALAQELHHDGIVAVYGYRVDGETPFIEMEFVEGTPLDVLIFERGGRFDEAAFRELAMQVLAIVAYAHERGVVHRDLKPANIIVQPDGRVKLLDFGIAASLKELTALTTGQAVSLTIQYAAPEQINGDRPAPSMDIYALGCVFYHMLTGSPPFVRGDIARQHLTKMPPSMEGVSRHIEQLVLACLVKDPSKRLRSPADVVKRFGGPGAARSKGRARSTAKSLCRLGLTFYRTGENLFQRAAKRPTIAAVIMLALGLSLLFLALTHTFPYVGRSPVAGALREVPDTARSTPAFGTPTTPVSPLPQKSDAGAFPREFSGPQTDRADPERQEDARPSGTDVVSVPTPRPIATTPPAPSIRSTVEVEEARVRNTPNDDELWGDLGDAYIAVGDTVSARGAYAVARLIEPDDREWRGKEGDMTEAASLLRRFSIRDDEWIGDLGDQAAQLGGTAAAVMLYRLAAEIDPADEEWQRKLGARNTGGQASGAPPRPLPSGPSVAEVSARVRSQPKNDELWGDLGDAYIAVGDTVSARGAYAVARLIEPDDREWRGKEGDMTEAASLLRRFSIRDDEWIGDLGDQALRLNRTAAAVMLYLLAAEIDPKDGEWQEKLSALRRR